MATGSLIGRLGPTSFYSFVPTQPMAVARQWCASQVSISYTNTLFNRVMTLSRWSGSTWTTIASANSAHGAGGFYSEAGVNQFPLYRLSFADGSGTPTVEVTLRFRFSASSGVKIYYFTPAGVDMHAPEHNYKANAGASMTWALQDYCKP